MPLWVAVSLGIGMGAFLVYGVPLLYYVLPTHVSLHKKALIRNDRQQPIPLEYKKMKEFSILDAGATSILSITGIDEIEHLIGMPKDLDKSSVESYLIEKGVARRAEPVDGVQ